MSGIRGKNTKPEIMIRKALFARGFRYRLHTSALPGKPDIVFPRYRAVIFVHGCFWHGHDCHLFRWPKTRQDFWQTKIFRNRENDASAVKRLAADDWRILTVWECALKGKTRLPFKDIVETICSWLPSGDAACEISGSRTD